MANFQPLTYHHSHFLAATFDFTTFSPCSYFKKAALFFYSVDVLVQIILTGVCQDNQNTFSQLIVIFFSDKHNSVVARATSSIVNLLLYVTVQCLLVCCSPFNSCTINLCIRPPLRTHFILLAVKGVNMQTHVRLSNESPCSDQIYLCRGTSSTVCTTS